jgi:hypothetical protein
VRHLLSLFPCKLTHSTMKCRKTRFVNLAIHLFLVIFILTSRYHFNDTCTILKWFFFWQLQLSEITVITKRVFLHFMVEWVSLHGNKLSRCLTDGTLRVTHRKWHKLWFPASVCIGNRYNLMVKQPYEIAKKYVQHLQFHFCIVSCFLVFSIVNSRTISHDTQRGGGARWRHIIQYLR